MVEEKVGATQRAFRHVMDRFDRTIVGDLTPEGFIDEVKGAPAP
jgi:hypothetical protein